MNSDITIFEELCLKYLGRIFNRLHVLAILYALDLEHKLADDKESIDAIHTLIHNLEEAENLSS